MFAQGEAGTSIVSVLAASTPWREKSKHHSVALDLINAS